GISSKMRFPATGKIPKPSWAAASAACAASGVFGSPSSFTAAIVRDVRWKGSSISVGFAAAGEGAGRTRSVRTRQRGCQTPLGGGLLDERRSVAALPPARRAGLSEEGHRLQGPDAAPRGRGRVAEG